MKNNVYFTNRELIYNIDIAHTANSKYVYHIIYVKNIHKFRYLNLNNHII